MWRWLPCWTMQLQDSPPITGSSTGQHGPGMPLTAHPATRLAVLLKGMVFPQVRVACQTGEEGHPKGGGLLEGTVRIKGGETDLLCSVTQLCPTLWDPMDCSLSGSSVHGILLATLLEWVAISSSRGSQGPNPHLLCFLHWQVDSLPAEPWDWPTLQRTKPRT